jgi:hypothetical protein
MLVNLLWSNAKYIIVHDEASLCLNRRIHDVAKLTAAVKERWVFNLHVNSPCRVFDLSFET